MDQQDDSFGHDAAAIERALRSLADTVLDHDAIDELTRIISSYAQALDAPISMALIARIAAHYARDHQRVRALREDAEALEWAVVVAQMLHFVAARSAEPPDSAALAALGHKVYAAVRDDLDRYRFESSFETWIALRTVCHFSRLWREL